MKCSHVMINGEITYKGKKFLLLFLYILGITSLYALINSLVTLESLQSSLPSTLILLTNTINRSKSDWSDSP
jgi:hypothetical protein